MSPRVWSQADLAVAKIGVWGLGRSGIPTALKLAALGADVVASDDHPTDGMKDALEGSSARFDDFDPTSVDLLVPSPGVPPHHRVVAAAVSARVDVRSEVDLAAGMIHEPIVAVTGTNGKTTTTRMIGHILDAAGKRTVVAGNIGTPLMDHLGEEADVWVVEVSSFSLRFAPSFAPRVAVVTNVAHDHLDWHGGFDAYLADKGRIAVNQGTGDTLVVPIDQPALAGFAQPGVNTLTFGDGGDCAPHEDGIRRGEHRASIPGIASRGLPFLLDAMAAVLATEEFGVGFDGACEALASFQVDDHRMIEVATIGGVRWINDSKATNPHAAAAAIASCPEAVLIAGGRNKGLTFDELAAHGSRLRKVIAMGECAEQIRDAFEGSPVPVVLASGLADAVRIASETAIPGDVVLLSPAAASQDMFVDYADRGRQFAALVQQMDVSQ